MKTVKFYNSGNTVRVFDYDDEQVTSDITSAVYTVEQDLMGFYLRFVSNRFEVPSKIYGSAPSRVSKVMRSYDDRNKSTGILLTGDKGSGKTMLSSLISNQMLERGFPVILVERPFVGTQFIEFLNNIGECVLFFDEFGKIFSTTRGKSSDGLEFGNGRDTNPANNPQDGLLSVFDGAHSIKRLILLTENSASDINSYMLNRPGRMYYHFKYKKLEEDLVKEYCQANNVPSSVIESIILRIASSVEFSFDSLKAVVEEYNRFKEDIQEVFSNLNIEESRANPTKIKVLKLVDTKSEKELEPISCFNFVGGIRVDFKDYDEDEEYTDDIYFSTKDIVEKKGNKTVYVNPQISKMAIIEEEKEQTYSDYMKFLAY